MRQLKIGSARGALTGLRQSLPAVAITRKRVSAAMGIATLLVGGAYALRASRAPRLRDARISAGLRHVTDGPEGYVVVSVSGSTFLAPASQRLMIESYAGANELMSFTLTTEVIDGLRVGTLR